jgi:undecaprenyl phosphate-alpha-L-ara4N flippase subunit ArnE
MTPLRSAATLGLFALAFATLVGRELCFKLAADQASRRGGAASASLARPAFWLGIAVGAAAIATWVGVLQRAPLGVAYPIMASTYAGVPVASALLFRERLSRSQVAGVALVTAGVACVLLSEL